MVATKRTSLLYILIGIIGAIVLLWGRVFENSPQLYYVLGSALLLLLALQQKLYYFVALELILIAGHGAILFGLGKVLQIALPLLLCFQLMFYYALTEQLKNKFLLVGVLGIALLSASFAYQNEWIFLLGSVSIAIYSFHCMYHKQMATAIWGVLNSCFALYAVYQLMRSYHG